MRLRVIHHNSPFCPILARFMGYYSPFWGPGAISMVVELQVAITCMSSTLLILSDSARLMGYCSPSEVPERFPQLMIPEVRLCVGHQH